MDASTTAEERMLCALCCGPVQNPRKMKCSHLCCAVCAKAFGGHAKAMAALGLGKPAAADAVLVCLWCGAATPHSELADCGDDDRVEAGAACWHQNCAEEVAYWCEYCGFLCARHNEEIHRAVAGLRKKHDVRCVWEEGARWGIVQKSAAVMCRAHGTRCTHFCETCGEYVCYECSEKGCRAHAKREMKASEEDMAAVEKACAETEAAVAGCRMSKPSASVREELRRQVEEKREEWKVFIDKEMDRISSEIEEAGA